MARYTGPSTRIARKFGEAIFGDDKAFEKRNYPPGQHGMAKKRGKKSEYAVQLMEKQKAKYSYGILEKQFRNLFEKASATKGVTGEVLLQLCEARLDNVVFRMGIAPSRRGARQIVSHRHITVNSDTAKPEQLFKAKLLFVKITSQGFVRRKLSSSFSMLVIKTSTITSTVNRASGLIN